MCMSMFGIRAFNIAAKYWSAHSACTASSVPPQVMRSGGAFRGVGVARERRRSRIDQPDEIRPRADAGERVARCAVRLVIALEHHRRRRGKLGAGRKTHDADFV